MGAGDQTTAACGQNAAMVALIRQRDHAARLERVCRAMVAASRPTADPDRLTPAPRGSMGLIPIWRTYEHLARAAINAMEAPDA